MSSPIQPDRDIMSIMGDISEACGAIQKGEASAAYGDLSSAQFDINRLLKDDKYKEFFSSPEGKKVLEYLQNAQVDLAKAAKDYQVDLGYAFQSQYQLEEAISTLHPLPPFPPSPEPLPPLPPTPKPTPEPLPPLPPIPPSPEPLPPIKPVPEPEQPITPVINPEAPPTEKK